MISLQHHCALCYSTGSVAEDREQAQKTFGHKHGNLQHATANIYKPEVAYDKQTWWLWHQVKQRKLSAWMLEQNEPSDL